MAKSKRIVYLTSEQYAELVANETLTVDGVTITYNDTDIYVTPQAPAVAQSDFDDLLNQINASPTEATAQDLLASLTTDTSLNDIFLTVLGWYIDNLPQNESAQDIVNALKLEADRLEQIYDFWIAEKEGA